MTFGLKSFSATILLALLPCRVSATNEIVEVAIERDILVSLYRYTNGDFWTRNLNWNSPEFHHCDWEGISCISPDASSRQLSDQVVDKRSVDAIDLADNNLEGSVPLSLLLLLPNIRLIRLNGNNVNYNKIAEQEQETLGTILDVTTVTVESNVQHLDVSRTSVETLTRIFSAGNGGTEIHTPYLTDFYASEAKIQGPIQELMMKIVSLERLELEHNLITGTIPWNLAQLTNIKYLNIADNSMEGTLPDSFNLLKKLHYLLAEKNRFTGTIPAGLKSGEYTPLLEQIDLSDQRSEDTQPGPSSGLSGLVPAFDTQKRLRRVDLGVNSFTGTIPPRLLNAIASAEFDFIILSSNLLTGSVPSSVLQRLPTDGIFLENNKITGVSNCPTSEFGCSSVLCPPRFYEPRAGRQEETNRPCLECKWNTKYWGQTTCKLEENSPTDLPAPTTPRPTLSPASPPTINVQTLTPTQGPSEGPPVVGVDQKAILMELYVSSGGDKWANTDGWSRPDDSDTFCSWHGIVCVSEVDRSVKYLHLGNNNMNGSITPSIYSLPDLTSIDMSHNEGLLVTFEGIVNAQSLKSIDFSSTFITNVEGIVDAAPWLQELHINDIRGFSGKQIPVELYTLTNLRQLTFDDNSAVGNLAEDLGVLSKLGVFSAANNGLTGPLPNSISGLTELSSLRLSSNHLSGSLPSGFDMLTSLSLLDLSNQWSNGQDDDFDDSGRAGFTGPLPSLAQFTQLRRVDLGVNSFSGTIPQSFLAGIDNDSEGGLFEFADIGDNALTGIVPSSLGRLTTVRMQDNKLAGIDQRVCDSLPETLKSFGCNAVLCKPGTYNQFGRQISADKPCSQCSLVGGAPYYGSTECVATLQATQEVPVGSPLASLTTHSSERSALELIYDSCGGLNWSFENNWKDEYLSLCLWEGIQCSPENVVIGISLRAANLIGTFPTRAVLQGIPSLKSLILDGNSIKFPFTGVEHAKNLETLDLTSTELDDVKGIEDASTLKSVYFSSNNLHGEFPSSLQQLTNLERLDLAFNALSKTIPTTLNVFTNLEFLSLHDNELTGTIPSSLGELSNLFFLLLQANELTGSIPTELNLMTKMGFIDLSSQNAQNGEGLNGTLPSFSAFSEVKRINLSGNKLTGSIPDDFLAQATDQYFEHLDLSQNQLTGTVPSALAKFSVELYDVTSNHFSSIAPELCGTRLGCNAVLCAKGTYNSNGRQIHDDDICENCVTNQFFGMTICGASEGTPTLAPVSSTKFSAFDVLSKFYDATNGDSWRMKDRWKQEGTNVCLWYGVICSSEEDGEVEDIVLSSNNLVGTVPPEIFQLPYLKALVLDSNLIVMQDLSRIEDAKQLQTLDLSNTGIEDLVGIGKAQALRELHIKSNNLNGQFPSEIFSIVTLEQLDFDFCLFSGTIGGEIGQLSSLKALSGDRNKLSGSLPKEMENLSNLGTMRLGRNSFSGSIPSSLNALSSLTLLDLSDQTEHGGPGLSGQLPAFDGLSHLTQLILKSNAISGTVPDNFLQDVIPSLFEYADLSSNAISGSIPSALSQLSHVHFQNNLIAGVAEEMCSASRGLIYQEYSCDAVLCPPKTFNPHGRQESATSGCSVCEEATFWGTTSCPPNYNTPLPAMSEREVLVKLFNSCGGEFWNDNENWLSTSSICTWSGIQCVPGFNESRIEVVQLGANNMVGQTPTELFSLPSLSILSLYSNPLETIDFTGIENARNLKELVLDATGLSSVHGLENAKSLETLNLRFNQLTNSFPSEIAALKSLRTLTMSYNDMTGTLPAFLEEMTNLKSILLSSNSFTGNLHGVNFPASLRRLDLSHNALTGSIPSSFLALVHFQSALEIDLSENAFTGSLPTVLGRFSVFTLFISDNQLSEIDGQLCSMRNWNEGDVGKYGCDAILCPPGSSAPNGRQSSSGMCKQCENGGSQFFGSSNCEPTSSAHRLSVHVAILMSLGWSLCILRLL